MAGVKGKSGTNPNSLKNLTNIADNVTSDDFKKNGKKGGIASGKARRERRDMQKRIQDIFNMPIRKGEAGDFDSLSEASGQNLTVMDACILALYQKAMKGDVRAFETLRDTAGMKPVERQEITAEVKSEGKLNEILNALYGDDKGE